MGLERSHFRRVWSISWKCLCTHSHPSMARSLSQNIQRTLKGSSETSPAPFTYPPSLEKSPVKSISHVPQAQLPLPQSPRRSPGA